MPTTFAILTFVSFSFLSKFTRSPNIWGTVTFCFNVLNCFLKKKKATQIKKSDTNQDIADSTLFNLSYAQPMTIPFLTDIVAPDEIAPVLPLVPFTFKLFPFRAISPELLSNVISFVASTL